MSRLFLIALLIDLKSKPEVSANLTFDCGGSINLES